MFGGLFKIVLVAAVGAMIGGIYLSDPENYKATARYAEGLTKRQTIGSSAPVAQSTAPAIVAVQRVGYGYESLAADPGGQYRAVVEFEGVGLPMMVDTGATLVSLTYEDAAKIGYAPAPADYTVPIQTANGSARAAPLKLREVRLGTLLVSDVPALVMPRDVRGTSLLGMSFLKKLGEFKVASGVLVMRQ